MPDSNLHKIIHSFRYDLDEAAPRVPELALRALQRRDTKTLPKKPKPARKNPPLLGPDLPPSLAENLVIIFVGFNPGVASSHTQHHYAHHSNLFWKLFNQLDLLSVVKGDSTDPLLEELYVDGKSAVKPCHDNLLTRFGIGFLDLVLRCTQRAEHLSPQEKLQNVPRLMSEFKQSHAQHIVIVGKGIWEVMCKFLDPHAKDRFVWGLQPQNSVMDALHSRCGYQPNVFVFPSTSGLVASMTYEQKFALWRELAAVVSASLASLHIA